MTMKLTSTLLLLAGVSGVLYLAAPPAFAADAGTIKIGALFSVTGPASFLGAPEEKTARMLVEKSTPRGASAAASWNWWSRTPGAAPRRRSPLPGN